MLPEFPDNRIFYSMYVTSFTNLAAGPIIQPGGLRVGDPWRPVRYYTVSCTRAQQKGREIKDKGNVKRNGGRSTV
jgi:hypothetical protein